MIITSRKKRVLCGQGGAKEVLLECGQHSIFFTEVVISQLFDFKLFFKQHVYVLCILLYMNAVTYYFKKYPTKEKKNAYKSIRKRQIVQ